MAELPSQNFIWRLVQLAHRGSRMAGLAATAVVRGFVQHANRWGDVADLPQTPVHRAKFLPAHCSSGVASLPTRALYRGRENQPLVEVMWLASLQHSCVLPELYTISTYADILAFRGGSRFYIWLYQEVSVFEAFLYPCRDLESSTQQCSKWSASKVRTRKHNK